jgi:hypothetical protein
MPNRSDLVGSEHRDFVGIIAGFLIYGSLAAGVWQVSDFLSDHRTFNLLTRSWQKNPTYHFNEFLSIFLVVVLMTGFVVRSFRVDPALKQQRYNQRVENAYFYIAAVSATVCLGMVAVTLVAWLGSTGPLRIGEPFQWVTWWSVVIGWSALSALFSCLQYRRAPVVKMLRIDVYEDAQITRMVGLNR